MKINLKDKKLWKLVASIMGICLCIVVLVSFIYLEKNNAELKDQNLQLQEALKNSSDSLNQVQTEENTLTDALNAAAAKNQAFSNQLDSVNNTVDTLQNLVHTDPQLLQKYSKVYFLNENYVPSALTDIDTKYIFNKSKPQQFHDRAWPFLSHLLSDAISDGVDIQVLSAYRSFGTQAALKSSYKVTYGAGTANSFSADQGYSEHQLGTALDFTTASVGSTLTGFDKTPAYDWLAQNAYKYGFIFSYPPHNAYYIYEPWHWRFVGLDLAAYMHTNNLHFYDLDQRTISSYLIHIFNNATTSASITPDITTSTTN